MLPQVHIGDPVLLEHVNSGMGLHVEGDKASLTLPDGRREVLGTPQASALKLTQARRAVEEEDGGRGRLVLKACACRQSLPGGCTCTMWVCHVVSCQFGLRVSGYGIPLLW